MNEKESQRRRAVQLLSSGVQIRWSWVWNPSVANAINILQACIYKFVKIGHFLKPFVATSGVEFKIIMLFCARTWSLKVKTGISILNLSACGATIDLKNKPVLQTCKYRPVKRLYHWLQVVGFFLLLSFPTIVDFIVEDLSRWCLSTYDVKSKKWIPLCAGDKIGLTDKERRKMLRGEPLSSFSIRLVKVFKVRKKEFCDKMDKKVSRCLSTRA